MKPFLKLHRFFLIAAVLVSLLQAQNDQWFAAPGREVAVRISNTWISLSTASNGQFTLGAEKGSLKYENLAAMDMTFGHPNGYGIDSIGSSCLWLRNASGNVTAFHELSGPPVTAEGNTSKCVRKYSDFLITQNLSLDENPETSAANRFRLSWSVSNTSAEKRKLDLRLLLDTWAGANDGVPFRTPRYAENQLLIGKKLIEREAAFGPGQIDFWETYETSSSRLAIICFGSLVPEHGFSPDRVQLLSWKRVRPMAFDAVADPAVQVTGDSAIALDWIDQNFDAGESRVYETFYGIRLYNEEGVNYPAAVDVRRNPFHITLTRLNTTDSILRGSVTLGKLPPNVSLVDNEVRSKNYLIEPGSEKTIIFTLTALPTAGNNFNVDLIIDQQGVQKTVSCRIHNMLAENPITVTPAANRGTNITATFYDVAGEISGRIFPVASLLNRQGKLMEKIVLYDDGKHDDQAAGDNIWAAVFKTLPDAGDWQVVTTLVKAE